MLNVGMYVLFIIILTIILIIINFITYKRIINKEKRRAFECGFDQKGRSRVQFCMKFFLVGVIFLIFDVEVRLILPLPYSQSYVIIFLLLLVVGLTFEWYYGGLE